MFASLALLFLHFCATTSSHYSDTTMASCNATLPATFPPPDTLSTSVLCVDQSGCCNFTTVQGAIDSIPKNSTKRTILWINKGTYIEKVTVRKPNITFQGQGYGPSGFIAKNITFKNSAPTPKPGDIGAPAVAIRLSGDQAAFWGCGFFGAQDTLFDADGRHYFKDCFIEGSVDFIWGNARSLFENCILNCIEGEQPTRNEIVNAAITAQARDFVTNNTGFSFVNCTIKGDSQILLGRAYRPYSRVVFAHTYMTSIVAPEGWSDWGNPSNDRTVFYGEYMCTGEGANHSGRVPYTVNLSDEQVKPYLNTSYVDGENWLKPSADSLVTP
ncbi:hypothetical protein ACQ4PT_042138 [Festuca glaucescens]